MAFLKSLGLRRDIALGVVLEAAVTGLGIAGPLALKLVIDGLTSRSVTLLPLIMALALFVGAWSLGAVLSTARLAFSTRIIDRLTGHLVRRGVRGRLPDHARNRDGDSGQLIGLFERLPYALNVVVDGLGWRAVPLGFQVAGSLIILCGVVPWAYALGLGGVLLAYAVATGLAALRHHDWASIANAAATKVSADLGDILRNARRVVFNGALDLEVERIHRRFNEKSDANYGMIRSLTAMGAIQYGLIGTGLLVVLGFAVRDALAGRMTVSAFVLLQSYAFRLVIPLSGIGFMFSQAAGAIETVREVLAIGADLTEKTHLPISATGPAEVRLDAVGFRYKGADVGLDDVSLVIPAGAFVAIVGPNGSGKSTLAQIIAGVLEPSAGKVTINSHDMATVPPEDRHKLVLYVPQMVTLFNRTLGENGLYPPTTQTESTLRALLTKWRFYDAGQGIDLGRVAGEAGERLSGGQLQKLEVARIIGVQVPVLLLDESTSALDPAGEADVLATLRQAIARQTTLIVVTHRQSWAALADQVLFMQGGTLVAKNTHFALMGEPAYASLWNNSKPSQ